MARAVGRSKVLVSAHPSEGLPLQGLGGVWGNKGRRHLHLRKSGTCTYRSLVSCRRARAILSDALAAGNPKLPCVRAPLSLGVLQDSWLLKGCRQKFLDAFLGAAKIEHIMPKVGALRWLGGWPLVLTAGRALSPRLGACAKRPGVAWNKSERLGSRLAWPCPQLLAPCPWHRQVEIISEGDQVNEVRGAAPAVLSTLLRTLERPASTALHMLQLFRLGGLLGSSPPWRRLPPGS